jgi:hypothetical protein
MIQEMLQAISDHLREQGWDAEYMFDAQRVSVNIEDPNLNGPVFVEIEPDECLLIVNTREKKPWRTCSCEMDLASPTSFDELEQYLNVLKSGEYDGS